MDPLPLDQILDQIEPERIPAAIMRLTAILLAKPAPPSNGATTPAPVSTETLDVAAIAKTLKKSRRWVWRHSKQLKFLRKVGRELVASRRDVERWLADQKIK